MRSRRHHCPMVDSLSRSRMAYFLVLLFLGACVDTPGTRENISAQDEELYEDESPSPIGTSTPGIGPTPSNAETPSLTDLPTDMPSPTYTPMENSVTPDVEITGSPGGITPTREPVESEGSPSPKSPTPHPSPTPAPSTPVSPSPISEEPTLPDTWATPHISPWPSSSPSLSPEVTETPEYTPWPMTTETPATTIVPLTPSATLSADSPTPPTSLSPTPTPVFSPTPGEPPDADGDGFVDQDWGGQDCDDHDAGIYPGAEETPYDGIDQDCDGEDLTDVDHDGFDASEVGGEDCDDEDSEVSPASDEYCDGIDNNCNGFIDETNSVDADIWYFDGDGDGHGNSDTSILSCEEPSGFVADATDCDDDYLWGYEEICDGFDNDCDGAADYIGGHAVTEVGFAPLAIVSGDWNGDGHIDLATANAFDNSISLLFYTGGGGYDVRHTLEVNEAPTALCAHDFDGDGFQDLLINSTDESTLQLFINDGHGSFVLAQEISLDFTPGAVVAGDWDGDGRIDAAVADTSGGIAWLKNKGGGLLEIQGWLATAAGSWGLTVGDWNGDGFPDLGVSNSDANSVSIILNTGRTDSSRFLHYTYADTGLEPRGLVSDDFNGDGLEDIAVSNMSDSTVSFFKGTGTGVFAEWSTIAVGTHPNALFAIDIDHDTDIDLLSADSDSHTVSIMRNDGKGNFALMESAPVGHNPRSLVAADFDEDGDIDVATANESGDAFIGRVFVLKQQDNGLYTPVGFLSTGERAYHVIAVDLVGDSQKEIVVSTLWDSAIQVYKWSDDDLVLWSTTFIDYWPALMDAADLDNDGDIDLAVANEHDNGLFYILLNDGTGHFDLESYEVASTSGVVIGDYDGDGSPDIAYTVRWDGSSSGNAAGILWNVGDGSFVAGELISVGDGPYAIAAGDIDGDGDLDLVTTNYESQSLSVLVNGGNGVFTRANDLIASAPADIRMTDLNGDNYVDLIVAENVPDGGPRIYLNNQGGSFESGQVQNLGTYAWSVALGDINDDGNIDLLVSSIDGGTVNFVIGDGFGGFRKASMIGLGGGGYFTVPITLPDGTAGFVSTSYYTRGITVAKQVCQ